MRADHPHSPTVSFEQIAAQLTLKVLAGIIVLHASSTFVGLFVKDGWDLSSWLPGILVINIWYIRAIHRAEFRKTTRERLLLFFLGIEKDFSARRWVTPILIPALLTALVSLEWSAAAIGFALLLHLRWVNDLPITEGK
jgi:hypothetical protein